ncbi:MAG: FHA domain-containing protein [Acidobacteriota bacterium]
MTEFLDGVREGGAKGEVWDLTTVNFDVLELYKLLNERNAWAGRLKKLDQNKESVTAEIWKKLRAEYDQKLKARENELLAVRERMRKRLDEMTKLKDAIEREFPGLYKRREELNLRFDLGDFNQEFYDYVNGELNYQIDVRQKKVEVLGKNLGHYKDALSREETPGGAEKPAEKESDSDGFGKGGGSGGPSVAAAPPPAIEMPPPAPAPPKPVQREYAREVVRPSRRAVTPRREELAVPEPENEAPRDASAPDVATIAVSEAVKEVREARESEMKAEPMPRVVAVAEPEPGVAPASLHSEETLRGTEIDVPAIDAAAVEDAPAASQVMFPPGDEEDEDESPLFGASIDDDATFVPTTKAPPPVLEVTDEASITDEASVEIEEIAEEVPMEFVDVPAEEADDLDAEEDRGPAGGSDEDELPTTRFMADAGGGPGEESLRPAGGVEEIDEDIEEDLEVESAFEAPNVDSYLDSIAESGRHADGGVEELDDDGATSDLDAENVEEDLSGIVDDDDEGLHPGREIHLDESAAEMEVESRRGPATTRLPSGNVGLKAATAPTSELGNVDPEREEAKKILEEVNLEELERAVEGMDGELDDEELRGFARDVSGRRSEGTTPPPAVLEVVEGINLGKVFPLSRTSNVTSIGKAPDNTIAMPEDKALSRYHAKIIFRQNRFVIMDLDSTNGTGVNGEAITEADLNDEDEIIMGGSRYIFRITARS